MTEPDPRFHQTQAVRCSTALWVAPRDRVYPLRVARKPNPILDRESQLRRAQPAPQSATGEWRGTSSALNPPDQGLCGGNGFVMEAINDVLRVYDTLEESAKPAWSISTHSTDMLQRLFAQARSVPEITDPNCYFDQATQRWFLTVLTLDRVGTKSVTHIGHESPGHCSQHDRQPTGAIYHLSPAGCRMMARKARQTHNCAGGPCLGDYPHQ